MPSQNEYQNQFNALSPLDRELAIATGSGIPTTIKIENDHLFTPHSKEKLLKALAEQAPHLIDTFKAALEALMEQKKRLVELGKNPIQDAETLNKIYSALAILKQSIDSTKNVLLAVLSTPRISRNLGQVRLFRGNVIFHKLLDPVYDMLGSIADATTKAADKFLITNPDLAYLLHSDFRQTNIVGEEEPTAPSNYDLVKELGLDKLPVKVLVYFVLFLLVSLSADKSDTDKNKALNEARLAKLYNLVSGSDFSAVSSEEINTILTTINSIFDVVSEVGSLPEIQAQLSTYLTAENQDKPRIAYREMVEDDNDGYVGDDNERESETNLNVVINPEEITRGNYRVIVPITIGNESINANFLRRTLSQVVSNSKSLFIDTLTLPNENELTAFNLESNGRDLFITVNIEGNWIPVLKFADIEAMLETAIDDGQAGESPVNVELAHIDLKSVVATDLTLAQVQSGVDLSETGEEDDEPVVSERQTSSGRANVANGTAYDNDQELVGRFTAGTEITVLGYSADGELLAVQFRDQNDVLITGWVNSDFVTIEDESVLTAITPEELLEIANADAETDTTEEEPVPVEIAVVSTRSNIRTEEGSLLLTVDEDTRLVIISHHPTMRMQGHTGWIKVQLEDGEEGFILAANVTVETELTTNIAASGEIGEEVVPVEVEVAPTQRANVTEIPPTSTEAVLIQLANGSYVSTEVPAIATNYTLAAEVQLVNADGSWVSGWEGLGDILNQRNLGMDTDSDLDCYITYTINGVEYATPALFTTDEANVLIAYNQNGGVLIRFEKAVNPVVAPEDQSNESSSALPETITHNGREITVLADTDIAEIDGIEINMGWNDVEMPLDGTYRDSVPLATDNRGNPWETVFIKGIFIQNGENGQIELFIPNANNGEGGTILGTSVATGDGIIQLTGINDFNILPGDGVPRLRVGQIVVLEVVTSEDNSNHNIAVAMSQWNGETTEETIESATDSIGDDFIAVRRFIYRD